MLRCKKNYPKGLFIWLLIFNVVALGAITTIAIIAASTRSDCSSSSSSNSTTGIVEVAPGCNSFEKLSALVQREASYFQSIHTFLGQSIATLSLIIFEPSLTAMVWSSLGTGKLTVTNFGRNVDFSNSPNPSYLINYLGSQRPSLSLQVVFVVFLTAMSQAFTFMVSPIYKTHKGPFSTEAFVVNGGGINTEVWSSFDPWTAVTPRGFIAGQSLISGQAFAHIGIPPKVSYLEPLVFIPPNSTQVIWHGRIRTVAVRPSLDCSSAAATYLTKTSTSVPFVNLNASDFFVANEGVVWRKLHPTFAGKDVGALGSEPSLAAIYLNASFVSGPGFVTGNASVIFLAVNGTLEGAQQTIISPEPTSRIKSIDALACTSTVRLEVSICTIKLGKVASCDFEPLFSDASTYPLGGVEVFIKNAGDVAMALAASPALAIPQWYNILPLYDITPDIISARVLPFVFMSTNETRLPYHIPLSYVEDVLFGQVMRLMVQGILSVTEFQASELQGFLLISTFGASSPILICAVMVSGLFISAVAITSAYIAGNPLKFDAIRLLSLAKSPELTKMLIDAVERPEILHSTVVYDREHDELIVGSETIGYDSDVEKKLITYD